MIEGEVKEVREQLELLIQMQQIDHQLTRHRDAKESLPQRIEKARQLLDQAREEKRALSASIEAASLERRTREGDLAEAEERVAKVKGRTSEIKTNKEYQAHLVEVELLKRSVGESEEVLLVLMERGDALRQELREAEKKAEEAERFFAVEKTRLEEEGAEHGREVERFSAERKGVAVKVDEALAREYAKLFETRKGLAVVPIRSGICTGCNFNLPPQLVAEAKKGERIIHCSYCLRILYYASSP